MKNSKKRLYQSCISMLGYNFSSKVITLAAILVSNQFILVDFVLVFDSHSLNYSNSQNFISSIIIKNK